MNDPPKVRLKTFQVHLQHGTQLLVRSQHDAQRLRQLSFHSQHACLSIRYLVKISISYKKVFEQVHRMTQDCCCLREAMSS